jgi:auxin efflux carrier family protein
LKDDKSESSNATINRAKTIILLNSIVQQCFTFAIGPEVLKKGHSDAQDRLLPGPDGTRPTIQDSEHVGLLTDHDGLEEDGHSEDIRATIRELEDTPDIHWPHRIKFLEKPLKKAMSFVNPPLIGAAISLILGV